MQFKSHTEILESSKKYEGEDKQDLEYVAGLVKANKLELAEHEANKLDTNIWEECFVPCISDELNPEYLFSSTDNELLCKIVSGEIDPKELAWKMLRNRGYDANGKWVGFGRKKCKKPF